MHKIKIGLGLLALTLMSSVANATTITDGYLTFFSTHMAGHFDFVIGGTPVHGDFDESTWIREKSESFHEWTNTFAGPGPGTTDQYTMRIGDSSYFFLTSTGSPLNVTTSGVTLVAGQTTYYGDFEFNGALCGRLQANRSNPACDIAFPSLTGHGTAEFTFTEEILSEGHSLFTPVRATYTFVPEPGTLALFGMGLVGLFFTARRQIHRH